MSDDRNAPEPLPPPHVQLVQMSTAYWVSRIVYVAAKLELADLLAGGPKARPSSLARPALTNARSTG